MVYVFNVEAAQSMIEDLKYYRECLEGLQQYSPNAAVFLLVHKMDLARERNTMFEKKKKELQEASGEANVTVLGTSIYDESLYKVS